MCSDEKLLVNKQMIKTGIDDIPNASGIKEAINKKENDNEFLADLKARQVYAQSVYQNRPLDSTIPQDDSGSQEYYMQGNDENSIFTAENSSDVIDVPIIKVENNSDFLSKILKPNKSMATSLKEFLFENYRGRQFVLSDGKNAIIDGGDAKELSKKTGETGIAKISKLDEIISNAKHYKDITDVEHPKFNEFSYYRFVLQIGEKSYDLLLNVGKGTFDKQYHIYAITNYNKKETASGISLSGSEDNQIIKAVSNNIIRNESEIVKGNDENSIFTEHSPEGPAADAVGDYVFEKAGRQRLTDEQLKISHIANKLGRKVVFETFTDNADGYIVDGVIHINTKAKNPIKFIFKHELTHYAEGSELYGLFVKAVKESKAFEKWINQKVSSEGSVGHKAAVYRDNVINRYAQNNITLSPAEAENELIADFVGENLFNSDGSGLESIMNDMTIPQRKTFTQYIKDFIAYIKQKMSRTKHGTNDILKLEKMFNEVLSTVEQDVTEGNRKNSIAENFDVEFEKAIANDDYYKNNVFVIGKMPQLYSKFGLNTELDLTITAKHLRNAIMPKNPEKHQHGLSKGKIKSAVLMLNSPAIISYNDSGILYVTVNETDIDNVPITFVIKPNGDVSLENTKGQSNHALSIYGRDNTFNFINGKILNNHTLYANKKEITELEQVLGKQFSDQLFKSDFNYIISKYKEIVNKNNSKKQYSIPESQSALLDRYENGEISREEYIEQLNENWGKANEQFGIMEQGEKAVTPIAVPKAVENGKITRRFTRTILETGTITGEMLEDFSTDVLLGKNFAYEVISDEKAQAKADDTIAKKQGRNVYSLFTICNIYNLAIIMMNYYKKQKRSSHLI